MFMDSFLVHALHFSASSSERHTGEMARPSCYPEEAPFFPQVNSPRNSARQYSTIYHAQKCFRAKNFTGGAFPSLLPHSRPQPPQGPKYLDTFFVTDVVDEHACHSTG
jgi:hypothetical protein